jgi:3-deoxy-7-phosphoheptulonate synthase
MKRPSHSGEGRRAICNILDGKDPRLLVITGPCSIHDETAALDYARRLKTLSERVADTMLLVMRVYFEKPRTNVGWKGLINDPWLNGSYDINTGLNRARRLLLRITEMGLPTATEMLDPIVPQYIAGWSAGPPSAREPPNPRPTVRWPAAFPCPWGSRTAPMGTCPRPSTP